MAILKTKFYLHKKSLVDSTRLIVAHQFNTAKAAYQFQEEHAATKGFVVGTGRYIINRISGTSIVLVEVNG